MKATKYLPAVAAVAVALLSTSSFADSADIRFRVGAGSFGIDIGTPPPVRVVAYAPVAMPGDVWVPGYWAWNGHRQVWNSGVWERPRWHYRQLARHWEQRDFVRPVRYEDRRDPGFARGRDSRRDHSR